MKELQEIREDILLLRNLGNIPKEVEMVLLRKLNSVEQQLSIQRVVGQSEQLCGCDAPLIRTSDKGGEYCGLCEKDLD